MTFAWYHPNYYKKLKKEAASSKPQATSNKLQACDKLSRDNSPLDISPKHQAPSYKRQASSAT